MKYFVPGLISLLLLSVAAAAQSGRRPQGTPTPAPPPITAASKEFSESRPGDRFGPEPAPYASLRNSADPDSAEGEDVVRIETRLVTIPVSVFDRSGLYITGLSQEDFRIFEDGREQEISVFGTTEQPFTVVLMLDTSPSTVYRIEDIQQAAIAFTEQLGPMDQVMVIKFDKNFRVLAEPTSDRKKLKKAIRKAKVGGGTSIYDAVDFALSRRLPGSNGRKAIVLFTDGVDTTSDNASYISTMLDAEEADATVFPIYYNTFRDTRRVAGISRGTSAEEYRTGLRYVVDIAERTGGRVFNADATVDGLNRAFLSIADELRRQYFIGYYPADAGKPGERKTIRVRVMRPDLIVRARGSYIVGGR